jgi:RNA polymerase sigma-70 factor (ECF subfamily)
MRQPGRSRCGPPFAPGLPGAMEAHGTDAGQAPKRCPRWTTRALMVLFARGDAEAARLLTERLLPRALRHAARVLGDAAEAEDVAQEAMMRLWKAAADWRSDGPAQPATWLHRVVANLAVDRLRRAGRATGLDPETAAAIPTARRARRRGWPRPTGWPRSTPRSRPCPNGSGRRWCCGISRGMSNPEIAEVLEIGVEAVESLTARGKRALKAALDGKKEALGYGG